jgi:hypothetical protein
MFPAVRGSSAPSQAVRFSWWLVSWICIAGGLLAATGANAQSSSRAPYDSVGYGRVITPTYTTHALHLHGGLFRPIDGSTTSPTIGLRFGRHLGSHLQGGLLAGWTYRRKDLEQPVDGGPGLNPHIVLARLEGHLVPAMLFLQVNFTDTRFLVPYAGIAGGYEWFSIVANDYRTDETAKKTYANLAWESWGGIGMRLGGDLRLDTEVFYNGGSLERDITDSAGVSWKEAIDANGVGARVGLDILF